MDDLQFVRIVWCDTAGIRRCRVVTRSRYDAGKFSLGLANVCLFLPCFGDVAPPHPASSPVGEMRLTPLCDIEPKRLPWNPRDFISFSTMQTEDGDAYPLCPVHALHDALRCLEGEAGVSLLVGFESEFNLMHKPISAAAVDFSPVDDSVYCQTSGFESLSEILREICASLQVLGQNIEQVHAESAPGQYEIVTAPQDAISAAESLILRKETISAIAQKHGLVASFLPKIFQNQAGNGCHCHFSFQDNRMTDRERLYSLSALGEAFAAGILAHLPALMIFTAGSPNSFRRIAPGTWSGAYQCWGANNKEAPLRLVGLPGDPSTINFELKTFDGTANPYLGLTAMIAAGLLGIREGLSLPDPVQVDPGILTEEERSSMGFGRLPSSLDLAIDSFEEDKSLQGIMAEFTGSRALTEAYIAMKRLEAKHFREMSFEDEAKLLYARY